MKRLVIMAGLPGSGKSFIRSQRYADLEVIDCDEIKKTIPSYDPKNPTTTHSQSKVLEQQAIYSALGAGKSFVYDTTATNWSRIAKLIFDAKGLGYEVELCYVSVSLKTAMERNAKRERVVPTDVIERKFAELPYSLLVLQNLVDNYIVVKND